MLLGVHCPQSVSQSVSQRRAISVRQPDRRLDNALAHLFSLHETRGGCARLLQCALPITSDYLMAGSVSASRRHASPFPAFPHLLSLPSPPPLTPQTSAQALPPSERPPHLGGVSCWGAGSEALSSCFHPSASHFCI